MTMPDERARALRFAGDRSCDMFPRMGYASPEERHRPGSFRSECPRGALNKHPLPIDACDNPSFARLRSGFLFV